MNLHWNYFISLERDLENLSRYIEFTEANFKTYSTELVRLYLASCSEIDVLLKQLGEFDSEKQKCNILEYRKVLTKSLPEIAKEIIYIKGYPITLQPWIDWQGNIGAETPNPKWWLSHNSVKHDRAKNYPEANLKNVIDAMAGLLVLNFYFVKVKQLSNLIDSEVYNFLNPKPSLFYFDESKYFDFKHFDLYRRIDRLSRRW